MEEARVDCERFARPDRVERCAVALVWDQLQREPWWRTYRDEHLLEVNHIEPRRGRGYQAGCWNHQANLESLCRRCHHAVTRLQRLGLHGPAVTLLGRRTVRQPTLGGTLGA